MSTEPTAAHRERAREITAKFLSHLGMGPEHGYPEDEHEGCCSDIIAQALADAETDGARRERERTDLAWRLALVNAKYPDGWDRSRAANAVSAEYERQSTIQAPADGREA